MSAAGCERVFTDQMSGVREDRPERAAAARAAARARGKHSGRPAKLSEAKIRQVRRLRAGGESISELVVGFGVSRATVYRALREEPPADAQAN